MNGFLAVRVTVKHHLMMIIRHRSFHSDLGVRVYAIPHIFPGKNRYAREVFTIFPSPANVMKYLFEDARGLRRDQDLGVGPLP